MKQKKRQNIQPKAVSCPVKLARRIYENLQKVTKNGLDPGRTQESAETAETIHVMSRSQTGGDVDMCVSRKWSRRQTAFDTPLYAVPKEASKKK